MCPNAGERDNVSFHHEYPAMTTLEMVTMKSMRRAIPTPSSVSTTFTVNSLVQPTIHATSREPIWREGRAGRRGPQSSSMRQAQGRGNTTTGP